MNNFMSLSNTLWAPLSTSDLHFSRAGYASCIGVDVRLKSADGYISAGEVLERVHEDTSTYLITQDLEAATLCRNPVVGAVSTRAAGVRILWVDGSSIELTTGHMLPCSEVKMFGEEGGYDFPISEQYIIRAGDVDSGLIVSGKEVQAVEPLGTIDAVRLWTYFPAWASVSNRSATLPLDVTVMCY